MAVSSKDATSKASTFKASPRLAGMLTRTRAFGRKTDGATAVEFSLVAIPFFALLVGTFDVGLSNWAQANLEQAVADASRSIYTGAFQSANASTTNTTSLINAFRTLLCTDNGQPRATLFACANVKINITVTNDFSKVTPASPTKVDSSGKRDWDPDFGKSYACATANSVVLVQAAVDYPVFSTLLNPTAVSLPGNKRVLQAAAVFRAEPYDKASC